MLVTELYVYPVKSLAGIPLTSAAVSDRGFQFDRRWMLVDKDGQFISQREVPALALLQPGIHDNHLVVRHLQVDATPLFVPLQPARQELRTVQIWSDSCRAVDAGQMAATWFSDLLSIDCSLVYMPEETRRRVDTRYARNKEITSFSDGYPFMILGQASLDDLNRRLPEPLPMNRFRPNIVFSGGQPYAEDRMEEFRIGPVTFFGIKRCARCIITTINQENLSRTREPLKTLAGYRAKNNNIYFGQNLVHQGEGTISVGDSIEVVNT